MTARLATLDEIAVAVWDELVRAASDKAHAWHTPVLATVDVQGDGVRADARTIVLREVNARSKELLLFTDARAAKARQLVAHPEGTLVMWSKALGWQLRCRVRLTIAGEGLAVSSRWATLRMSPAAQDYLSPLPPGTPLATMPPALAQREHFGVITATVGELDWLELHPEGHRRAIFGPAGATWVQP